MALKTCYGHFKKQLIFFSLTNVSTTFQGYINKILAEKFDVFIIIYFNNIFIYTESKRKEHMEVI